MTEKAYLRGAREATALAERCERDADMYDEQWRARCLREAKRHRERAEWYLQRAQWEREGSTAA